MFDVFYAGVKPNLFAHEQAVDSIEEAQALSRTRFFWFVNYLSDYRGFDFLWEPKPWERHQRHAWPSQHQPDSETYLVPKTGYTETNYNKDVVIARLSHNDNWTVPDNIDIKTVDFTWHPNPLDPPYIYHFPSQYQSSSGVTYTVPGATEIKLINDFVITTTSSTDNWHIPDNIDINSVDFTWHPNPLDPSYIYHFPSQHQSSSGVTYTVPGATEIKLVNDFVIATIKNTDNWTVPDNIDIKTVDFTWHPNPLDPPYVYHFGDEYQESSGLIYTVPGATEIKLAESVKPQARVLDMFFIDKSNQQSASRYAALQEKYPHIQKTRFANSTVETIKRCASKSKTSRFWVLSSDIVYDDFDFAWHPNTWQNYMTHVFGSQWNKWSDTFLVNKWEFERHAKWAKNIKDFPNLNFVQNQQVSAPADAHDIYVIEHGNSPTREYLEQRYRVVRSARYFDNYLDTLRRLLAGVESEHVWVVSSLCDYSHFDFSWQPEAWQQDMLHVFPSNEQKFGDTFYVPVAALQAKINEIELLDWFETVNYCTDQIVPRWPMPVIQHDADSHVDAVLASNFSEPLAVFTNRAVDTTKLPTVSIWREKTKTIVPLDAGAGSVIVPKNAIASIKTQLYDYAYIDRTRKNTLTPEPLDIVFISNGEPVADQTFVHLQNVAADLFNKKKIHRIDRVNGRVAAYHAAAQVSTTPWFFAVFAKLFVNEGFDWSWQPDRMQQPKHYIFHALNPVNGLEYGHQAMIAYNKQLVLNNTGSGLDFTLDDAHEVVPVLSGTAVYNMSPWVAWRTAFREAIKLKSSLPDIDNEYRLTQWLSTNPGSQHILNEEWSRWGAEDAVEYFDEVAGEFAALKKSYEWDWLASYAFIKRNLTPDQQ